MSYAVNILLKGGSGVLPGMFAGRPFCLDSDTKSDSKGPEDA